MGEKENIIRERTYNFALRIIRLVGKLPKRTEGFVLGKQVLKSGTSVGANVEEAIAAISREEFIYKMSVALKEARETSYWLRLIKDSGLLPASKMEAIIQEAEEIKKILGSIVKTSRRKGKENRF